MSIYTQNQSKDKLTGTEGFIGSLTCYYNDDREGVSIQLTSLEEGWYSHEACIDHPEASEYPTGVNKPFMKLMAEKVAYSVLSRTGIDIRDYDGVIHASTFPAKDKEGNVIYDDHKSVIRNV